MEHDFIFVVLDRDLIINVVEEFNDEGRLAEMYPNSIYFYAKVTT